MIPTPPRAALLLALISSVAIAIAQTSASDPPFDAERRLVRRRKYQEAITAFEQLARKGVCAGAACHANMAIALAGVKQTDSALQEAEKAIDRLDETPLLSPWEANEVGVILFRAPKRTPAQLASAVRAFRFARSHYTGRASNMAFNLERTLRELGETAEADTIARELETRLLIDGTFSILGDFQGAGVQR